MSFMHTKAQVLDGSKTVTRRLGWWFLRGGEELRAVEKARGLRAQEIRALRVIRVLEVRRERLDRMLREPRYGRAECRLEGYPELTPAQFVQMFCDTHKGCTPATEVNRIHFR